jgi:hypothetical protein
MEMKENGNLSWGLEFSKGNEFGKKFIEESLEATVDEFDRYIDYNKEVPWWYQERPLLGFFASGLVREKKHTVLQEYCCEKGKKEVKVVKEVGRADLWIGHSDLKDSPEPGILLEAKHCYWDIMKNDEMKNNEWEIDWEKEALKQASDYTGDRAAHIQYVCSLCFVSLYSTIEGFKQIAERMKYWEDLSRFPTTEDGYFYSVISLNDKNLENEKKLYTGGDTYLYPAVLISGIFQKKRK